MAGIGVRTLLAITRDSNLPGNFPPGISGYSNDASSPFWQESTPFSLESGNFRANFWGDSRNSSRTAAGTDTVRHDAFCTPSARLLPAPFPPRHRPPRAARLPWPHDLAGTLGGKAPAGKGPAEGQTCTYTQRAAPQGK
jgi:hypothetical protein